MRCTGHCCKDFTLPLSPIEFEHWKRYEEKTNKSRWKDFRKVSSMVIFLRSDYQNPNTPNGEKVKGIVHHYTCKHYNKTTGDCMDYENRPRMCSEFPYKMKCNYKGCTRKE